MTLPGKLDRAMPERKTSAQSIFSVVTKAKPQKLVTQSPSAYMIAAMSGFDQRDKSLGCISVMARPLPPVTLSINN